MPTEQDTWNRLVEALRSGDERSTSQFYARYGPLLERVASGHLASGILRRVGPDDVAHSVCRTFLRRVQHGEFDLVDRRGLWQLLCSITVAKARKKARHHLAQRRSVRQESGAEIASTDIDRAALELADHAPTPADTAELVDEFEHLLSSLDDEERRVVCLKLEHHTHEEIAELCSSSERTVRRILQRVETRLRQQADARDDG